MVEAYAEAMADAGIETSQIDAAWFSTHIESSQCRQGRHAAVGRAAPAEHRR